MTISSRLLLRPQPIPIKTINGHNENSGLRTVKRHERAPITNGTVDRRNFTHTTIFHRQNENGCVQMSSFSPEGYPTHSERRSV